MFAWALAFKKNPLSFALSKSRACARMPALTFTSDHSVGADQRCQRRKGRYQENTRVLEHFVRPINSLRSESSTMIAGTKPKLT
jgi:hypothetical protein